MLTATAPFTTSITGSLPGGPASPEPTHQNCHYYTIHAIAPQLRPTTYRPGYASDVELIRRLQLNLGRGVPLAHVDISKLRGPNVIGVRNLHGGFDHTAAIVLTKTGRVIIQHFDVSQSTYTPGFRTSWAFLQQRVKYGNQTRQSFATNTGRVQVFAVGGGWPQLAK